MSDENEASNVALSSVEHELTLLRNKVNFHVIPELNQLKRKLYKTEALLTSYKALVENIEYHSLKDTNKLEAATKCLHSVCVAIKRSPLCHNNPELHSLFECHAELQKQLDE